MKVRRMFLLSQERRYPMSEESEKPREHRAEKDKSKAEGMPAAGPHDKPELQDPMKTPGTGSLPKVGSRGTDVGPD